MRQNDDLRHPPAPAARPLAVGDMGLARGEEPALSEVEGNLQSHYPSSSVNIGIYEAIAEFTLGVVMCQEPLVAR